MSRARVHEVSSPISLFPFIGILLCTMGALLVVLVAVSRDARTTAEREVQAKQSKPTVDEGTKKKLAYVQQYVGVLDSVRSKAERTLRDEHQHLSNVEDHIRRLQEKMRSLQVAAAELEGLEREHYDDRAQAHREIQRLNQLIEESKKSIEKLQEEAEKAPTSYAVVPYEGPNGTYRRPMYIECVKEGVVLQPEGVHLSTDDLRPPYGAGNPLAATLRTTRDHLIRLYPKEGQSRQTEPYPLLLVRAEGLVNYDRARQAIEAGDFDLGFELVEDHWKLKFPTPDPQLVSLQQQALEQARARQQVLAAAAPRAYRGEGGEGERYGFDDEARDGSSDGNYSGGYGDGGSGGGGGGSGDGGSGGSGRSGNGGGSLAGGGGLPGAGGSGVPGAGGSGVPGGGSAGNGVGIPGGLGGGAREIAGGGGSGGGNGGAVGSAGGGGGAFAGGVGAGNSGATGAGAGSNGGGRGAGAGPASGDGVNMPGSELGGGPNAPSEPIAGASGGDDGGDPGAGAAGGMNGGSAGGGMAGGYSGAPSGSMAGGGGSGGSGMASGGSGSSPAMTSSDPSMPPDANAQQNVSMMYGSPPPDPSRNMRDDEKRHRSLAETRGKDWALKQKPQRATAVRRTIRVVVRNDQLRILPEGATPNSAGGKVVPIQGDTVLALDAFVKDVHDEIDGWGMAGNGLYWRPVIVLSVAPQGERRANDLERLLKNSGLELRTDDVANNAATRKVQ